MKVDSKRANKLMTKQRIIATDLISEMSDIREMNDVWLKIRERHQISFARVYNIVGIWVKEGLIIREKNNYGYIYFFARDL